MRTFAFLTGLALVTAAVATIAGLAAAAFVDTGSAVVIAVVVALGTAVIGFLEWSHRRHQQRPITPTLAGRHGEHHGSPRALDELRAARTGTGHTAVSHALRSV